MFSYFIQAMVANNVNFTSRCLQIKEAQQACHIVAANFPHFSSTRLSPFVCDIEDRFPKVYDKFLSANPAAGRFITPANNDEKKILSIFSYMKQLIRKINICRDSRGFFNDFLDIKAILNQLKIDKCGNCYENARLTELILRLNEKKNVYTASINVGDCKVDHVVCFFNKDGSPFSGTIENNKTIIVDSWLNEADFAGNMLKKYKNMYKDFLFMPKEGKISFRQVESLDLTKEELAQLASEFPQLLK